MNVSTKFDRFMFNQSEVIVLTNKHSDSVENINFAMHPAMLCRLRIIYTNLKAIRWFTLIDLQFIFLILYKIHCKITSTKFLQTFFFYLFINLYHFAVIFVTKRTKKFVLS